MIIAVDFDGTLCENKWPKIGPPRAWLIRYLEFLKSKGHKIILWTCRTGDKLDAAVKWCKKFDLEFDAVNENLPEIIEAFGSDTRKIYADCYLDDLNITLEQIEKQIEWGKQVGQYVAKYREKEIQEKGGT